MFFMENYAGFECRGLENLENERPEPQQVTNITKLGFCYPFCVKTESYIGSDICYVVKQ